MRRFSCNLSRVVRLPVRELNAIQMHAAYEPEYDQNDQYQAESATKSRATIAIVTIVTATAAQQHNQQNYNENSAHFAFPFLA